MLLNPDQAALENEAKIVPLINEKKRLFNELLTTKGTHHNFLLYPFSIPQDKNEEIMLIHVETKIKTTHHIVLFSTEIPN